MFAMIWLNIVETIYIEGAAMIGILGLFGILISIVTHIAEKYTIRQYDKHNHS